MLVVTNNRDDGSTGSLPWAIVQANLPGADTITFAPAVFDTPQTITLSSALPALTGMALTTIQDRGQPAHR